MLQMPRQVRVNPRIITRIAIHVAAALGRDRAQLDADAMARRGKVLKRVTVAAYAAELLTTAVDGAAGETKPEVGSEVAL